MHYDPKVFQEQFPLVKFFVQHLFYYRELRNAYGSLGLQSPFWVFTIDAHLARAVICWCMVFGAHGCNPTHWKKLSKNNVDYLRTSFRKWLFSHTNFTPRTWETYWKEIVAFRNEYVAHRELEYKKPVPTFDLALEVAYVYDSWIRDVIVPDIFDEPPLKKSAAELQQLIRPFAIDLLTKTPPPAEK